MERWALKKQGKTWSSKIPLEVIFRLDLQPFLDFVAENAAKILDHMKCLIFIWKHRMTDIHFVCQ